MAGDPTDDTANESNLTIKTKKAAVSKALIEYIQNLEQEKILSMFGMVEYGPEYDYKQQRSR